MLATSDPRFVPPHCPRPTCDFHRNPAGWKFDGDGVHVRKAHPQVIRRFRCRACGRSFSTQTFDTTYWLKRPDIQIPILHGLQACSGFRQLGRSLGVAGTTVERQASRLGRHALLHLERERPPGLLREPLAIDGLVSFEYSQYWPFEINIAVGVQSRFIYAFIDSELRRSGRMTKRQQLRRSQLEEAHGTPDPQATQKAVERLIHLAVRSPQEVKALTDKHLAYPKAFDAAPHEVEHVTFTSRRDRGAGNPLQAVDHVDRMIRHSNANHKRETIAFSKRRQGAMERMAVMVAWLNFTKRRSEKDLSSPTPAQEMGLRSAATTQEEFLRRRLFPSLVTLPDDMKQVYDRNLPTRQIPNGTTHRLAYAA